MSGTAKSDEIRDQAVAAILWMDEQLQVERQMLLTFDGTVYRVWAEAGSDNDNQVVVGKANRLLAAILNAAEKWDRKRRPS